MRLPVLAVSSLPIVLCVAAIAAQSSPEKPAASPQLSRPSDVQANGLRKDARANDARLNYAVTVGQNDNDSDNDNDATCYTIRAYRVSRVSPGSDTTKPAGYSTCQRANRFQFKTAVDSREIAPR